MHPTERLTRTINARSKVDPRSLGRRIRLARKHRQLSQAEVALHIGIKPQSVAQWETGQSPTSLERLLDLAMLFKVDFVWLASGLRVGGIDEERTAETNAEAKEAAESGRWWT